MRRTFRFVASCGAALVLLAPAAFASSVSKPQVDAAQQVTTDPNPVRAYATPSVAVDPKNQDVLAVSGATVLVIHEADNTLSVLHMT